MPLQNGSDYLPKHSTTYSFISPLKLDLTGKTVFITGASKGIGSALALSYAKAGASTIGLGARSPLTEFPRILRSAAMHAGRSIEPRVFVYQMDVTDASSVENAAKRFTQDAETHLDILVNNAGYLSWNTITDSDPADWWMNYEVNVKGVYLCTKYFLPIMLHHPNSLKTVVNVSSVGAHNIAAGGSGYQSSKLAVCRLTEFIGVEYAEQGVLAYSVHPGSVPTQMGSILTKLRGLSN
ncbi:putative short chain dehydrogenase reductase [Phaeomoniella chlamydospora]|uniref:Putative short chain dehydrogenase reductase n=1 Tax=Phaeomoniella chlamydospora TaxID=158046 RepID=A0A0G2E5N0_PHACM|nr:putative short chain dehydrogenase reductase [Phaeomoniella chlamydospora]